MLKPVEGSTYVPINLDGCKYEVYDEENPSLGKCYYPLPSTGKWFVVIFACSATKTTNYGDGDSKTELVNMYNNLGLKPVGIYEGSNLYCFENASNLWAFVGDKQFKGFAWRIE